MGGCGRGAGKVAVRCLGPLRREHYFLSSDRARERVCWRCRQRLANMRVGAAADSPLPAAAGREFYCE